MNNTTDRQFAIVTGASSGIGLELARCCAENNFDLLIAADELRAAISHVVPSSVLAEQHRKAAGPGTARRT
jgi:short-subunit dehydrogenase